MAAPVAYGSSQTRGQLELQLQAYTTPTAMPYPSHICNYTAACCNARSLIHWVRPEIKPASSRHYVGSLTHWATMGTPNFILLWLSSFPNTIYWRACPFSIRSLFFVLLKWLSIYMWVYSWPLLSVSLIFGSVLCQHHTDLITIALCRVWNQRAWYISFVLLSQDCFCCYEYFVSIQILGNVF